MIKGVCGLAYDCKNADALADFMVHCLVGKKKFQVADGRHCVLRRDGYLFSGHRRLCRTCLAMGKWKTTIATYISLVEVLTDI